MTDLSGILILSDLDGTLLNDSLDISPENRAAIDDFSGKGGRFTVATGRSLAGTEHFFPRLRINAPAILYNGSLIYDFDTGRDVFSVNVGETGAALAARLEGEYPQLGVEAYAAHRPHVIQDGPRTRAHFASTRMPWHLCTREEVPQPWLSLVLTGEREDLSRAARDIEAWFPGRFFLQFSSEHLLEVMAAGASKGESSRRLQEYLGIPPDRVFAVGDGTNDVQLLSSTPHSCAPKNACPAILSRARHLLPDNEHHAIAALIHQIEKGELL